MQRYEGRQDEVGNRLLARLSTHDFESIRRHLDAVSLSYSEILIEPNVAIENVVFPVAALASLVTLLEDGSTVEGGSVGREGMVGVPPLLGAASTPMQTVVQIPGVGYRMRTREAKRMYDSRGSFHDLLSRYVHTIFVVASQSAACNRRHQVERRLARWLLMSSDGIGANELAITQEYLAAMLGVRRAGVTEAALALQKEGIIHYMRGFVQIVERRKLESRACECYRMTRHEYEKLFE